MTQDKSNRIFLGVVTLVLAIAGTGLTLINNWENEFQQAAIAIALAACFTAAEITFLWGHKRFENARKLNRKIALVCALGILITSMAIAFFEELTLVLSKQDNRVMAGNSAKVVESAKSSTAQTRLGIKAIDNLFKDKIKTNPLPFFFCYLITGIATIIILAASERKKPRTMTYGNQIPHNPQLQTHIRKIGMEPELTKAYRDSGHRGYAIHSKRGYEQFVSDRELSKYP